MWIFSFQSLQHCTYTLLPFTIGTNYSITHCSTVLKSPTFDQIVSYKHRLCFYIPVLEVWYSLLDPSHMTLSTCEAKLLHLSDTGTLRNCVCFLASLIYYCNTVTQNVSPHYLLIWLFGQSRISPETARGCGLQSSRRALRTSGLLTLHREFSLVQSAFTLTQ